MNTANPAFAALRAALENTTGSRSEIEIEGRRWIVERAPAPGEELRLTSHGPPPNASSQHFYATDDRPPSYPAWLPFIPGHQASVSVWGSPQCGSIAWSSVPDPDTLIQGLLEAMSREGWSESGNAPPQPDPAGGFRVFERAGRKRVVFSSGHSGEWTIVISDYPTTGQPQ